MHCDRSLCNAMLKCKWKSRMIVSVWMSIRPHAEKFHTLRKKVVVVLSFRSTRLVLSGSVHAYASGDVADRSLNELIRC